MIYKDSQSLLDFLTQLMPDWKGTVIELRKNPRGLTNGKAAKTLFQMWRDEKNNDGHYVLKRPSHISKEDVKIMQEAGFVRDLGEKVEITARGKDIIKTMILGDDKSIYEDNGLTLSYEASVANLKRRTKTARKTAACEHNRNWYQHLKLNGNN